MTDTILLSAESSKQASETVSNLGVSKAASNQPYQLTLKRGFLALFIMFASQTLVGLGFAFGFKFVPGMSEDADPIDFQLIG